MPSVFMLLQYTKKKKNRLGFIQRSKVNIDQRQSRLKMYISCLFYAIKPQYVAISWFFKPCWHYVRTRITRVSPGTHLTLRSSDFHVQNLGVGLFASWKGKVLCMLLEHFLRNIGTVYIYGFMNILEPLQLLRELNESVCWTELRLISTLSFLLWICSDACSNNVHSSNGHQGASSATLNTMTSALYFLHHVFPPLNTRQSPTAHFSHFYLWEHFYSRKSTAVECLFELELKKKTWPHCPDIFLNIRRLS